MIPNMNYQNLKESYLFYNIAQKTKAYLEAHPGAHLYRMGIGDVSLPLCDAVIQKLHEAVEDQAHKNNLSWIYAGMRRYGTSDNHCGILSKKRSKIKP